MANLQAIHSVGSSLVTYLGNAYPTDRTRYPACTFKLVSSGELNGDDVNLAPAVTLYLYRVTMNPYVRNTPNVNAGHSVAPLSVDLHYLMSIWADSAMAEHTILGWTLSQLYQHQTLSHSDLSPEGGWAPGDLVQVIPAELSNEDLMRIWDALDPGYRLSVSYIARVIRIDPEPGVESLPVVARRIQTESPGPGGRR
jgi:hypothetical protein